MNEIENISLKQYIALEDKSMYNFAMNHSRKLKVPLDVFKIGSFIKLPFGTVKDLQYRFTIGLGWENLIKTVEELTKLKQSEIVEEAFFTWCQFMYYVKNELKTIFTLESHLINETNEAGETEGAEGLAVFGGMIQIDSLAHGDIFKHDAAKALNYMNAYMKLLMDKRIKEYNYKRNKVKK